MYVSVFSCFRLCALFEKTKKIVVKLIISYTIAL